ncbi:MAG: non-homologous end-joining DNA ligase [Actinomycetota bacterium]|nr:non-homologous end-joining DNA ligase [Actinomycetota bacterium]
MLATAGDPPENPAGWAFEFKWDGVRAVVATGAGEVQTRGRTAHEITSSYPELRALAGPRRMLLDGEIIAMGEAGRPSFALLQRRMHVARPTARLLAQVPVHYVVFDLLHLDDTSLLSAPYLRRRELLAGLELPAEVQAPGHFTDVTGAKMLAVAEAEDLEGVLAKRLDSTYRPGVRSPVWIKTALRRTQEVVITGWTLGTGRRAATFGALVLGAHRDGRLHHVGQVGTGFSERQLRELMAVLRSLEVATCPLPDVPREIARIARWVRPVMVGEVEYRQWTPDGRMRAPSWRGLRSDLQPTQVHTPPIP